MIIAPYHNYAIRVSQYSLSLSALMMAVGFCNWQCELLLVIDLLLCRF